VVLQAHIFEGDQRARALLAQHGFSLVRTWIHLAIDMLAPPLPPHWPEGIAVRPMNQRRDWPMVGAAMDEAFADHWGQLPASGAEPDPPGDASAGEDADGGEEEDDPYSNSRDHCFVALAGDMVAGACLGNARTIEWPESGKVGSLSVRRAYRRRGIGRALMLHALGTFYGHGVRRVITDTDAASLTGANRLYLDLGMRIYRRELTYEKELRPGAELRVLAAGDLA
jgi:ribosomal protein S18 acetylase RimI-like enzyme